MSASPIHKTVADNLKRAEQIAARLDYSIKQLQAIMPLTTDTINQLSDEQVESLDAFAKRYEQLQDTLQNKLLRGIALLEQENISNYSRRDINNLMEKLGVIPSAKEFADYALIRNRLAHEYPDDPTRQSQRLNMAFQSASKLHQLVACVGTYLTQKSLL